jgi:hypothetical protein
MVTWTCTQLQLVYIFIWERNSGLSYLFKEKKKETHALRDFQQLHPWKTRLYHYFLTKKGRTEDQWETGRDVLHLRVIGRQKRMGSCGDVLIRVPHHMGPRSKGQEFVCLFLLGFGIHGPDVWWNVAGHRIGWDFCRYTTPTTEFHSDGAGLITLTMQLKLFI